MKRLNDSELRARIRGFLSRKFAEFPELAPGTDGDSSQHGSHRRSINNQ